MQKVQNLYRRGAMLVMSAFVMLMLAVPAFASSDVAGDLGAAALSGANSAIGKATLVAAVLIGFAIAYKAIRKVTG